ncbi:MAG: hypothetical protein ACOC97_04240 [Myxococcota bacterium]
MFRTPHRSGHFIRLRSLATLEDTVHRLDRALRRTPWRIAARIDGQLGEGPAAHPMHVFVISPRCEADTDGDHHDLTWSLLLPNEVLVYREADGTVVVAYQEGDPAEGTSAPRPHLAGWRRQLHAAVASAVGTGHDGALPAARRASG